MGKGTSKAGGGNSGGAFRFAEGSFEEIRNDIESAIRQKESKNFGFELLDSVTQEDMRDVDKALNYFKDNGIKELVEPSDTYPSEIKWEFAGKDKTTGKFASFEFDSSPKKSSALETLKGNGYSADKGQLLPKRLFSYLYDHTNLRTEDINAVNAISAAVLKRYKAK